jgi:hypothetical protein
MALSSITSAESTSPQTSAASAVLSAISASAATVESASNNERAASVAVSPVETVDTVTLQNRLQKAKPEVRSEKTVREEKSNNNTSRSVSDVLFDYNAKGDLRIKFMDSGNKLIYQTPPVLFAKITDLMSQPQSVVDTKV